MLGVHRLDPQLAWAFGGVLGLLALATIVGLVLRVAVKAPSAQKTIDNLNQRIRAWWVLCVIFGLTLVVGPTGSLVLFGLVSFLALREYVTLVPTRRADHHTLCSTTCSASSGPDSLSSFRSTRFSFCPP
jgi:phosphatidate cytidylyltransferase